jgi:hypothetical protein
MDRPRTFRAVQALAAEAGLVMSRDADTLHIRLRYRSRRHGPFWMAATIDEALAIIDRRARNRTIGFRLGQAASEGAA